MPVYEGIDIPALEWCSVRQAIVWIAHREAPVAKEFSSLPLPDRVEQGDWSNWEWDDGKGKLWLHICFSGVSIRGTQFCGDPAVDPNFDPDWYHGRAVPIPPEKVKKAGVSGLTDDGVLSWEAEDLPFDGPWQWAFSDIEVNFAQLMGTFPPGEGQTVRIGEDVLRVEELPPPPVRPSPLSLSEAISLRTNLESDRLYGGWLSPDEGDASAASCWLLRHLEAGNIGAIGKLSKSRANNYYANSPEEQQWEDHSHEWTDIPAGAWEEWGVDWQRSALKTRYGEYIEVRLDRAEVQNLEAAWQSLPANGSRKCAAKPPEQPCATLLQAIRWIALDLPPLEDEHEMLEGYPWLREPTDKDEKFYEAEGELLKVLAYGEIVALGTQWENNFSSERGCMAEKRVNGDFTEVRKSAWDVMSVELNENYVTDGEYRYRDIKIRMDDLRRAFITPSLRNTRQRIADNYLDKSHANYSPKLFAAIAAWQAVTADPALARGKSVKTAIEDWLKANAAGLGLLKSDGSLNNQGIGEVAKVANWVSTGGAPSTPGG